MAEIKSIKRGASPAEPTRLDLTNDIDRRLTQLNALLMSCYGGGQENFEELSPQGRDQLLWLASDLAIEAQQKFELLCGLERAATQPT